MPSSNQAASHLQILKQFREHEIYQEFLTSNEEFIETITSVVVNGAPKNLEEMVLREQAIGALQQARVVGRWFENKVSELTQIIKENEEV